MGYIVGPKATEAGGNWLIDKWNQAGDFVVGKEMELLFKPLGEFIQQAVIHSWHWFIVNLPDIIGYSAIGAGILIILSAMAGKGIIKPVGWFSGLFILAACILGGV
jgi:hypothetical protein